ncbi:hypothetical protein J7T55_014313 [Diaporthe amygdali]|uniref:uncharacterized protein n=1 Tax=Phomopsis amygdali TaxID=1214568 RepID=UPI0022FF0089|nr:uncharacterized protein J7T55_014313 [Diaporthe amygdali]KAJ0117863.1 hypothetical protein J7T55_014313 [Diaporthe amygdali]
MPDINSLPPSALSPPLSSSSVSASSPAAASGPASTSASAMSANANANGSEPVPAHGPNSSPSPNRSASTSLQAAAAVNAGLQHERSSNSRRSSGSLSRQVTSPSNGRRRSQVLMNLQINDPSVPGPGEMVPDAAHAHGHGHGHGHSHRSSFTSPTGPSVGSPLLMADPHHNRAPSLGELHQELEAEQEAQVNRLLSQIRQQQAQILQLQSHQNQSSSAIAGDESPGVTTPAPGAQPISTASNPTSAAPNISASGSLPRSPIFPRSSFDLARNDLRHRSRTPSRGASPRLRSTSISQDSGEPFALGGRDESAFYQAETQMLTRENQMLRHRIRDLERQLADTTPGGSTASVTHEPAHHSGLTRSESVSEEARPTGIQATHTLPIRETPKDE